MEPLGVVEPLTSPRRCGAMRVNSDDVGGGTPSTGASTGLTGRPKSAVPRMGLSSPSSLPGGGDSGSDEAQPDSPPPREGDGWAATADVPPPDAPADASTPDAVWRGDACEGCACAPPVVISASSSGSVGVPLPLRPNPTTHNASSPSGSASSPSGTPTLSALMAPRPPWPSPPGAASDAAPSDALWCSAPCTPLLLGLGPPPLPSPLWWVMLPMVMSSTSTGPRLPPLLRAPRGSLDVSLAPPMRGTASVEAKLLRPGARDEGPDIGSHDTGTAGRGKRGADAPPHAPAAPSPLPTMAPASEGAFEPALDSAAPSVTSSTEGDDLGDKASSGRLREVSLGGRRASWPSPDALMPSTRSRWSPMAPLAGNTKRPS